MSTSDLLPILCDGVFDSDCDSLPTLIYESDSESENESDSDPQSGGIVLAAKVVSEITVLLDSGANHSIFSSTEVLRNIRTIESSRCALHGDRGYPDRCSTHK